MRKNTLILIACALAAVSCNLNEDYYVSNVNDLVMAKDKTSMMNDYGVLYTITTDNSDHNWTVGERYMINFDIENIDYEITLKGYTKCIIDSASEMGENPSPGEDPVMVNGSTISGGYVNLHMDYYRKKDSNYAHRIFMEYKDNPGSEILNLTLIHDGNGENPVLMDKDELETVSDLYSFSIMNLVPHGESRLVKLTLHEIVGSKVEKKTYQLYNEYISF